MEMSSKCAHSQNQQGYVVAGQGSGVQHGSGWGARWLAAAYWQRECVLRLQVRPARFVDPKVSPAGLRGMLPNMSFERTVGHRGPRLAAARAAWSAAQLDR